MKDSICKMFKNLKIIFTYKNLILIIPLIFLSFAVDKFLKKMILIYFNINPNPVVLIPNFLNLQLVWNFGISFSLLENLPHTILIIISLLSLLLIIYLFNLLFDFNKKYIIISLCLLISGSLSNITDRINYAAVIDYISVSILGYSFPVFNLSDIFISISAMILFYDILQQNKIKEKEQEK
jgi:signal peptidase II